VLRGENANLLSVLRRPSSKRREFAEKVQVKIQDLTLSTPWKQAGGVVDYRPERRQSGGRNNSHDPPLHD